MASSRCIRWRCADRVLECGRRPLVMGILNVTPDSFYDGKQHFDVDDAVAYGLKMAADGARIIDVGGESTRPGAEEVTVDDEVRRVAPVIERLASEFAGTDDSAPVISIDTTKAEVARRAIAVGARIINDVSALSHDAEMVDVARESGAGVVLMHMQGSPRTMQSAPQYEDVVEEVREYLLSRIEDLVGNGLEQDTLAVDPGIGFGKTVEHNVQLLRGLESFHSLQRPVVVGLSRKSMFGKLTGRDVDDRLVPSIAALACCVTKGVNVIRVHDVKDSFDAALVAAALEGEEIHVQHN